MDDKIKLKDFVASVIVGICDGIQEAKEQTISSNSGNCPVAPATISGKNTSGDFTHTIADFTHTIDFDISLTASSEVSAEGKDGLSISVVKANAEAGSKKSDETMHRVKFSVPYVPQAVNAKGQKMA